MKTTSSELKKRAKLALSGNYGTAIGAMLIVDVILMIVALVCIGIVMSGTFALLKRAQYVEGGLVGSLIIVLAIYFLAVLLVYLFMCGIRRMLYNMSTGQPFALGDMLFAFTHRPHRFLGVYFIMLGVNLVFEIPFLVVNTVSGITGYIPVLVVLEVLMYLLQMIAIVVFSLYFGMVNYIIVENPERKVISCFRESAALMKGNKGRLLYLGLSFIGMIILGIGSFGIGFLWIFPYMETTSINFYLDISSKCGPEEACYDQEPFYDGGSRDGSYEDTAF